MKQFKFIVKIPINSDASTLVYKETKFATFAETCEFLDVSPCTLRAYMSGRLQLIHNKNKKLEGIIVERINLHTKKNCTKDKKKIEEENIIYKQNLLSKIDQLSS